jgi:hypothetical protein
MNIDVDPGVITDTIEAAATVHHVIEPDNIDVADPAQGAAAFMFAVGTLVTHARQTGPELKPAIAELLDAWDDVLESRNVDERLHGAFDTLRAVYTATV